MERGGTRFSVLCRETVITAGVAILVMLFGAVLLVNDPSYYWRDDYQLNYLPKFQEIARSLKQGEFPLLAPSTWQAGDMGGEYQFGIFSVWMLACIFGIFSLGLSLPLTAALLSLVHLGVLAAGAFRLARGQKLNIAASVLVAVTASLNGWVFVWGAMNWFVALASLAWLPWVWWSLDRALASNHPARFTVLAGGFIYLAVAAGWHFTTLMIGILTIWIILKSLTTDRKFWELWPLPIAWILGLGLSAPSWLMFLEYTPFTDRGQTSMRELSWEWTVPLSSLPGLIFPAQISSWSVFNRGWRPHRCVELAGVFVPLAVFAAAFSRLGTRWLRKIGWELALACFGLVLAMLPGAGNVRWSFRWLPLFFLAFGLIAGHGLNLLQRLPRRGGLSVIGLWAAGLCAAVLILEHARFGYLTPFSSQYGCVVLALCLLWAYLELRVPRAQTWLPAWAALASLGCFYAVPSAFLEVAHWEITAHSESSRPLLPGRRYLSICSYADIFNGDRVGTGVELCPGNCCLYQGHEFLNGYSPLRLTSLTTLFDFQTHGVLSREACERILLRETGSNALLEFLGVDGLLVSHDFASFLPHLRADGWEVTAEQERATVLHRVGPPSRRTRVVEKVQWNRGAKEIFDQLLHREDSCVPYLLAETPPWPGVDGSLGRADLEVLEENRSGIRLHVRTESTKSGSLIAVARPWYPGYVARLNGVSVPVYRLNQVIPAVLVPAGVEGTLILEYRPRSLTIGSMIGLAALVLSGILWRAGGVNPPGCLYRGVYTPRSPTLTATRTRSERIGTASLVAAED